MSTVYRQVLLIEDNQGDARLIREMLAESPRSDFEVQWCARLSTALERLGQGGVDLVLLDLTLPDSLGLDSLAAVRAHAGQAPIVVLTGLDDEVVAMQALRQGAQDYLVKDQVTAALLLRTMRYAIERKQAELEHERLQAELRQAQKMEAVGLLAGGVAHYFNNLLMVIQGNAEIALASMPASHPLHSRLSNIFTSVQRAAMLTGQLLAFGRGALLQLRDRDVNPWLEQIAQRARFLVGDQVVLELELGSDVGAVCMDAEALERTLLSMVTNAREAMPTGGSLHLASARVYLDKAWCQQHPELHAGEYVCISVADTGVGMPVEARERLFEPFFTTKSVGQGTGLSLAAAYGVVCQHGGWIDVQSAPGDGARFDIYLPALSKRGTPVNGTPSAQTGVAPA